MIYHFYLKNNSKCFANDKGACYNMAFLTIVLFGIVMTIFENIQAENNEISMPKNVNLSEGYEVNIPPSGGSLTWVSYEITRFSLKK